MEVSAAKAVQSQIARGQLFEGHAWSNPAHGKTSCAPRVTAPGLDERAADWGSQQLFTSRSSHSSTSTRNFPLSLICVAVAVLATTALRDVGALVTRD